MLNPDEIKDLLQNPTKPGAGGGLWEGESNPYDFLGAALKKDEKMQVVTKIHTVSAGGSSKILTQLCESEIACEFLNHEMKTTREVLSEISLEEVLPITWNDESLGFEGLVLIDRTLYFQLYNTLFGGVKSFIKKEHLTSLERTFLERILSPLIESMEMAWKSKSRIKFHVGDLLEDQHNLMALGWNFDCFKATFKVSGASLQEGKFSFVLPRVLLNSISEGDGDKDPNQLFGRDKHWTEAVIHAIKDKPLPVSVILGGIHLPVKKVLSLQPEEQFPLLLSGQGHQVLINGHPSFLGSMGMVDGHRAVKITKGV